jgi:hypothetical protein
MMLKIIFGILCGGLLGFGYHKLVGCSTGTCPLVSNPYIATLYGMILGALISSYIH